MSSDFFKNTHLLVMGYKDPPEFKITAKALSRRKPKSEILQQMEIGWDRNTA